MDPINNPYDVIDRLLTEKKSINDVKSYFESVITNETQNIVTMNTRPDPKQVINTLVHFRGLVQDTSQGNEIYNGGIDQPYNAIFGIESAQPTDTSFKTVQLQDRESYFFINPPGETSWFADQCNKKHKVLPETNENSHWVLEQDKQRFPFQNDPSNIGFSVKIYDEETKFSLLDTYDIYGILGQMDILANDSWGTSYDEEHQTVRQYVLHAIICKRQDSSVPLAKESDTNHQHDQMVDYLAATSYYGDKLASEWSAIALHTTDGISHLPKRTSATSHGSLVVNVTMSDQQDNAHVAQCLVNALKQSMRWVVHAPVDIDELNRKDTHVGLWLNNNDDTVASGKLFLRPGTVVVIDMSNLKEGVLDEVGLRTFESLVKAIQDQKIPIESAFFNTERDTRLHFIILSQGKALIPSDIVVPLYKRVESNVNPSLDIETLQSLREYGIYADTIHPVKMTDGLEDIIQKDFERRRKEPASHEAPMTPSRLAWRLSVAKLGPLDESRWNSVAELDDLAYQRFPNKLD